MTKRRIPSPARMWLLTCSRAAKALFIGDEGKVSREGQRLLSDLTKFAKLNGEHAFLRDLRGAIDPLSMARIEGRREVVLRLLNYLKLDPTAIDLFVEVDDGR